MDYSVKEDIVEYFFDRIKYFTLPSKNNKYKSRFLESNTLLYCVVLLVVLKVITVFVSFNIPNNIFFADITKIALENFVNQTRQSYGLQPLAESQKLDQAAQLKAENMVVNDYFAHTSPQGITPWYWFTHVEYNYKYAGENLAVGFFDSEEVYNAWLNSPSHKSNIINPNYKEVGTAVLTGYGENNAIVVVQEFGSQRVVSQTVTKNDNLTPVIGQQEKTAVINVDEPATPVSANNNNTNEKVLSQSTESESALESDNIGSSNIYSKIMNSILYSYGGLVQDVIYGTSLVVTGILVTMIFFSAKFDFRKKLVFRSVLIIVLLSLATVLNKNFLIAIIPHQITI